MGKKKLVLPLFTAITSLVFLMLNIVREKFITLLKRGKLIIFSFFLINNYHFFKESKPTNDGLLWQLYCPNSFCASEVLWYWVLLKQTTSSDLKLTLLPKNPLHAWHESHRGETVPSQILRPTENVNMTLKKTGISVQEEHSHVELFPFDSFHLATLNLY